MILISIAPQANAEISFNRDVRPILSDKCFKCHGPDASNQDSEFRVDSFDNATMDLGGYFGIVPGKREESELHVRIHDTDDPMPPEGSLKPLTKQDIAILDQWIVEGAKFESHWAFVPLPTNVDVPKSSELGKFADWPKSPIDHFIARAFLENDLTPSEEAPKTKWLRRVTFDLTGLPPTKNEIDAFVSDDSMDAKAKVVDRLLQSAAYAERMTSEWLDVARYADSYGYQRDDERYVWPYRDWVIDAFKNGMPYDQFVLWQLAGDLLPDATAEQKLATTFNRLHSHKKEGGVAIEEFRVENVADRTHTVGAAMLGLTMECCRCHDHKYDPITMKDYYSLSAFFDNIDERGLISYFTDAVPTPSMPLPSDEQQRKLDALRKELKAAEATWSNHLKDNVQKSFDEWLTRPHVNNLIPGNIVDLAFDEIKESEDKQNLHFKNMSGKDAVSGKANSLVDGRFGKAIKLTGDDAVDIPEVGHFARHDPFTFSLWIWSPEVKTRGVIYRHSRGWDDAGSVGYELTREDDKLSAKLCHFWPGNAIAIETVQSLEAKRWYHVGVTYDGSSRADGIRIYVNGKPARTRVIEDHLTRNITDWRGGYEDLAIGSRYRDRGFVGGKVDDFKVWDRQLSDIEIAHLLDNRSLFELLSVPAADLTAPQRDALHDYFVLAVDPVSKTALESLRQTRSAYNTHYDSIPAIMVMRENAQPRQTFVLTRGVYDARGEKVSPRTPEFLPPMPDDFPKNRLGLAFWLTSTDHPLTARVAVNRYWQLMFGSGLVSTPEDFGNQGELPSHPELLDWLARDFVDSRWDVRGLLKRIVLSATYQLSAMATDDQRERDPTNRYLARGTGDRLSAEMIRDNVLATSGLLIRKVGGPPVKPYDLALAYNPLKVDSGDKLYRRSLYTFWKRTSPAPVMMTLNTPTREVCRLKRETTDTPLQALVMLNGSQFIEASRVMATKLLERFPNDIDSVASTAFERLTSRQPTDQEQNILTTLYEEQLEEFSKQPKDAEQFLDVGQAILETKNEIPSQKIAAATVLINSIMNLDECVRHQ